MEKSAKPLFSIVMPVFNTGKFLYDSIGSILDQKPTMYCGVPDFELIVVDDGSNDIETLKIIRYFLNISSKIILLENHRAKGAAGARNSGIFRARGDWIAFIDSDDVWMPTSLAMRWDCIKKTPNVRWLAGPFKFLRPATNSLGGEDFDDRATLWMRCNIDHPPVEFVQMKSPVKEFGEKCLIGTTTVMIERDLILQKGLFNESLKRAEDYYLWFKCAHDQDLWMAKSEVSFYRIHTASLTHGDTPRLMYEDHMIEQLLREPEAVVHKKIYIRRLDAIMQDTCYFYRSKKSFGSASRTALKWIGKRPLNIAAWKELLACSLRVG